MQGLQAAEGVEILISIRETWDVAPEAQLDPGAVAGSAEATTQPRSQLPDWVCPYE